MSKIREQFETYFDALPSPDDVGESEYRLVYDFLDELLMEGEDLEVIFWALGEVSRNALIFRGALERLSEAQKDVS